MQGSDVAQPRATLVRQLGLLDSTALVVGVIIGSGIFLVPGSVAGHIQSVLGVIAVWVTGGILSIFGGLALAELGSSLPQAGGLYIYIERAYGRFTGFIYGWMGLCIINSGSVATMAAIRWPAIRIRRNSAMVRVLWSFLVAAVVVLAPGVASAQNSSLTNPNSLTTQDDPQHRV